MDKNNHKNEESQPQKKGDHHRKDIKRKRGDHLGSSKRNKGARSRAPQSGAVSEKRPSFCDLFTISKRLSLGLVASARILMRSARDLFADEEEVLLVFRDVVFRYYFCLQSEDVECPFGSLQLFGKRPSLVRDERSSNLDERRAQLCQSRKRRHRSCGAHVIAFAMRRAKFLCPRMERRAIVQI